MKTSATGVRMIGGFEGLRLTAYKPVAAEEFWTIGYGHYGPDVKKGMKITATKALSMLRADLASAESTVNKGVEVGLNQNRFNSLVSFAFNIGRAAFFQSTLLQELNRNHYSAVPGQLMRWVRGADGKVLQGLVNRRRKEAAPFQ